MWSASATGNRRAPRASAMTGCCKRSITSALVDSPRLVRARARRQDRVLHPAAGRAVAIDARDRRRPPRSHHRTGLHTFIDPRHGGGRQNASAKDDLIELITIDGEEWLRFKPLRFDVAILRGTTADEDGNITMEQEAIPGEMLSMAQATRRSGGIVIVQVKRVARAARCRRSSEDPRHPGRPRRGRSGAAADLRDRLRSDLCGRAARAARRMKPLPFGQRKIVARRAAMEFVPARSAISAPASRPASRRSPPRKTSSTASSLTNEQGFIGGAPLTGPDSGAAQNYDALVDQPYSVRLLRRRRARPRVPLLRRGRSGRQRQRQPLRRQDRRHRRLHQHQPERQERDLQRHLHGRRARGRLRRRRACASRTKAGSPAFVERIEHVCYSAPLRRREGRTALFVTERAVFSAVDGALELIEIAPGIDLEKDVLGHMGFRPRVCRSSSAWTSGCSAPSR